MLLFFRDDKGRDHAATGGNVCQFIRRKPCEGGADNAIEQKRVKINQLLHHRPLSNIVEHHGKHFFYRAHSFLNKIIAVCKCRLDRIVPFGFGRIPADVDAMATVIVIRFEHQLMTILTCPFEKIDLETFVQRLLGSEFSGPRHMCTDRVPLALVKKLGIFLIGKNGENSLFMYEFSAKAVNHAYRSCAVCVEQRRTFIHYRQIFIDKQPLVNHVYRNAAEIELAIIELQVFRCTDQCVVSGRFKMIAKELEFLYCGKVLKIDYRDHRLAICFTAAEFIPAANQNLKQFRTPFKTHYVETLSEFSHYRQRFKDVRSGIRERDSRRAFAVQLDKTIRILRKKRIQPRGWRDLTVTRVDLYELFLNVGNTEFVKERVVSHGSVLYLLQSAPDRLASEFNAVPINCGNKMGTEIRREGTPTEDQFVVVLAFLKNPEGLSGKALVLKEIVIVGYGLFYH